MSAPTIEPDPAQAAHMARAKSETIGHLESMLENVGNLWRSAAALNAELIAENRRLRAELSAARSEPTPTWGFLDD